MEPPERSRRFLPPSFEARPTFAQTQALVIIYLLVAVLAVTAVPPSTSYPMAVVAACIVFTVALWVSEYVALWVLARA